MGSLPFVFPVRGIEKRLEASKSIKECEPNTMHIPSGKPGPISGRVDGKGEIVVHDTCIRCGYSCNRAPNAEEMRLYEAMRNHSKDYKMPTFA
jgi:hypothetical protein